MCPYVIAMRPRSFFGIAFPAAANFATAPERGRLRLLAAGVRVHLGVEHEDVDLPSDGQNVVEPAESDVVRPAVAADHPDALRNEGVGERVEPAGVGIVDPGEPRAKRRNLRAPVANPGLAGPVRLRGARRRSRRRSVLPAFDEQRPREAQVGVYARGEPEAELRVVLEEGVRPRRAAPVAIDAPGRRREVAAVDRRTTGRVGDQEPIAEQLRQELQVGGLPAPGAGSRELEQRLARTACS